MAARCVWMMLVYATLTNGLPSPQPSTLTISFPPTPATALAQTWATDGSAGDASQWTGDTSGAGGDASQWTGSGASDASQWSGGGADAGAWSGDPAAYASMFTLDLEAMRRAHAVLASVCMLIFFPFGGIIIRLISPESHRHIVWFHAGVQMFAYCVFLGAAGVGIWMAVNFDVVTGYHPIIGMVVLTLLSIQPITEIVNHFLYDKYPRIIAMGHAHLWIGRIVITLGMINGGLGFVFADTIPYQPIWSVAPKIAYGIIAGLVWITYFVLCGVWQQVKYVRKASQGDGGELGGDEMEILRGRALEEAGARGTGSNLDVTRGSASGKRRASPRPTDPGFRSSAL